MAVACLCISGIALVLQTASVFTLYWATMTDSNDEKYAYKGLWTGCACFNDSCQCSRITNEPIALYHVLFVGAIPAILLSVLLDLLELRFESKLWWRACKILLSIGSATCIFVGVDRYSSVYDDVLTIYDIIIHGVFKPGWSFIMCAVAGVVLSGVAICHIVDIWRCSAQDYRRIR